MAKKKKPTVDKKPGWKAVEVASPGVQSPTWGQVQRMAESIIGVMGGPSGAASKLNGEAYYCLCILNSLMLDEKRSQIPILGAKVIR